MSFILNIVFIFYLSFVISYLLCFVSFVFLKVVLFKLTVIHRIVLIIIRVLYLFFIIIIICFFLFDGPKTNWAKGGPRQGPNQGPYYLLSVQQASQLKPTSASHSPQAQQATRNKPALSNGPAPSPTNPMAVVFFSLAHSRHAPHATV